MENQISEHQADQQESLTKERLKNIITPISDDSFKRDELLKTRPENSLIALMNWAKDVIRKLSPSKQDRNLIKLNNSKISIDGTFLEFCEENNVEIQCLLSDSVSSWKTDLGSEHFLASGIFEIKTKYFNFYHCALLHKSTKNEDDVSFFIIVDEKHFEKYVNFRNKYSEWVKQRNKDIAEIEVIGGDPILYTRDLTWDSIYLEQSIKDEIKTSVDGFLKSKDLFEKMQVPWKHSLAFWGERGCGKTLCLRVIMSVYKEFKPVTIQPGHMEPNEVLEEAFAFAQENAPSMLFLEDIQELLREVNPRQFLQLLDGVKGMDGILVIVTGNDLKSLEDNIANRPRRIDKKIEFPLPSIKMSDIYLSKWFSSILSDDEINKISKKTFKNKFTYSHLQHIYFNSVFIAVGQGREIPTKEDIEKSCDIVIKEKKTADDGFVSSGIVKKSITDYNDD